MNKRISFILAIVMALTLVIGAGAQPVYGNTEESGMALRVTGGNRYATAYEVAKRNNPNPDTVIIVRGDSEEGVPQVIDGLTASGLAGRMNAEILLVTRDSVPVATRNALHSLKPKNAVIIGGTAAVSDSVENEIKRLGIKTDRVYGSNRIETATAVAREIGSAKENTAIIVDGHAVVDSLVAGPLAHKGYPILMVNNQRGMIPEATKEVMTELGITRVIIVGGTAVVSRDLEQQLHAIPGVRVEQRFGGNDRIGTSLKLAEHKAFQGANGVSLVDGWTYVDAVAASTIGVPTIYYRERDGLTNEMMDLLEKKSDVWVIGTTPLVTEESKVQRETSNTRFQSSFYHKDHLKLSVDGNRSITVEGITESGQNYAWLQLQDSKGNRVVSEILPISSNGRYKKEISLSGSGIGSGNRVLQAILLMAPERITTYTSTHARIMLQESSSGLAFLRPSVYQHNLGLYETNNRVGSSDLSLSHLSEAQKVTVKNLAEDITRGARGDGEKVKAVHDWVAANIYYDYDGVRNNTRKKIDTISVLNNRIAVCQGYAELTVSLLRSLGIPTRMVNGFALGVSTSGRSWDEVNATSSNHAWNEAYVDGRWVMFDATWNSTNRYENGRKVDGEIRLTYFDLTMEALSNTHKVFNRQRTITNCY